jgi:hypothetical protein
MSSRAVACGIGQRHRALTEIASHEPGSQFDPERGHSRNTRSTSASTGKGRAERARPPYRHGPAGLGGLNDWRRSVVTALDLSISGTRASSWLGGW